MSVAGGAEDRSVESRTLNMVFKHIDVLPILTTTLDSQLYRQLLTWLLSM